MELVQKESFQSCIFITNSRVKIIQCCIYTSSQYPINKLLHSCLFLLNSSYGHDKESLNYLSNYQSSNELPLSSTSMIIDVLTLLKQTANSELELDFDTLCNDVSLQTIEAACHLFDSIIRTKEAQIIVIRENHISLIINALMHDSRPNVQEILKRIATRILNNPVLVHTLVANLSYSKIFEPLLNDASLKFQDLIKHFSKSLVTARLEIVPVVISLLDYTATNTEVISEEFQKERIAIALSYVTGPYFVHIMMNGLIDLSKFGAWAPTVEHSKRSWTIILDLVYELQHELSKRADLALRYIERYVPFALTEFRKKFANELRECRVASLLRNEAVNNCTAQEVPYSGTSARITENDLIALEFPDDVDGPATLSANSKLLCRASPALSSMLAGHFTESSERIIILHQEQSQTWKFALSFLSTTISTSLSTTELNDQVPKVFLLLNLAEKFLWDGLANDCCIFLTLACQHASLSEDWNLAFMVYNWSHYEFNPMYFRNHAKSLMEVSMRAVILCLRNRPLYSDISSSYTSLL